MIGITEAYDPAFDDSWIRKTQHTDGNIIITKRPSAFLNGRKRKAIEGQILHCSITGFGGTIVEPGVNPWETEIAAFNQLRAEGINVVLRIDPIIPTEKGLNRVKAILDSVELKDLRIRFSIIDNYKHIKDRGLNLPWSSFNAPEELANNTINIFKEAEKLGAEIEVCAERYAGLPKNWLQGCVSQKDLDYFGVKGDNSRKGQRGACLCIAAKTELLTQRSQCPHKCLYCYWKKDYNK